MSQQAQQLRNMANQLKDQPELNAGQKGIWEASTTPAQIIRLLDTVEAELNELKAARAAA